MTEDEKNQEAFERIFDNPVLAPEPEMEFFTLPKYKCARHGEIGNAALMFGFNTGQTGHPDIWCLRCISEAMEHLYICKAEKI